MEKEEKIESKIIQLQRVSHTRAGGKKIRFRVTLAAGDKKGRIGLAITSANDVSEAIQKAFRLAQKKMIEIPIVNDTIPHPVSCKFKTIRIILKPQKKGRGLRAGFTVKAICELAGIKNICSKKIGKSSNKMNIAQATIKALSMLKVQKEANF